ncbi:MAG: aspartate-semialdehyde dehydrogenase [bacterium]
MCSKKIRIAVVGATGLVGGEIVNQILKSKIRPSGLLLFSSERSSGHLVWTGREYLRVKPFRLKEVRGCDICFLAVGSEFSKRCAHRIANLGSIVIDNSSAFRMVPNVPLVVPEVNPEDIKRHRGLIANPNCSTIQLVVALAPLHRRWKARKVVVSTYQAVSGAGSQAVGELATQTQTILEGGKIVKGSLPKQIGFNLFPHIGDFDSEGWSAEESKMLNETRKILKNNEISVIATTVRVPVFRGHSEAVYVEFEHPVDLDTAREELGQAKGVRLMDRWQEGIYPTPVECANRRDVFVGRLRRIPGCPNAISMWIVSDNLLKGAALNAVQIAELLDLGTE